MEDMEIIELYFQREPRALEESSGKYGRLCTSIALRMLGSMDDSEECVNDTWLRAWNAIPPQRPSILRSFFAKITRNLALDRLRRDLAAKRGGSEVPLALDELSECVSGNAMESELEKKAVTDTLNAFLRELDVREREMFLRRYFLAESPAKIAGYMGCTANAVSTRLFRLRGKLRERLSEEGIEA